MDNRVLFTIIIGLLAFLWYRVHGRSAEPVTEPVTKSDPSDCKQILANAESKNLHIPLEARATNERLVRAYDIDNAFTTSRDDWYQEFNKEAGKSINMTEDEVGTL